MRNKTRIIIKGDPLPFVKSALSQRDEMEFHWGRFCEVIRSLSFVFWLFCHLFCRIMSIEDVCKYFIFLGADESDITGLKEGKVDAVALLEMAETDLKSLNIPIGIRKKFFLAKTKGQLHSSWVQENPPPPIPARRGAPKSILVEETKSSVSFTDRGVLLEDFSPLSSLVDLKKGDIVRVGPADDWFVVETKGKLSVVPKTSVRIIPDSISKQGSVELEGEFLVLMDEEKGVRRQVKVAFLGNGDIILQNHLVSGTSLLCSKPCSTMGHKYCLFIEAAAFKVHIRSSEQNAKDMFERISNIVSSTIQKNVEISKKLHNVPLSDTNERIAKQEQFEANYPVIIIPGLASSALDVVKSSSDKSMEGTRLWIGMGALASGKIFKPRNEVPKNADMKAAPEDSSHSSGDGLLDVLGGASEAAMFNPKMEKDVRAENSWIMHACLNDNRDGWSDPPGIQTRPVPGMAGCAYLSKDVLTSPLSYVFGYMFDALKRIGYVEGKNMVAMTYDWRCAIPKLEEKYSYFSLVKAEIERLYHMNGKRAVVIMAHSMVISS